MYHDTIYLQHDTEEVIKIATKSRADYFKERRKTTKSFYVEIEKEKMEKFEQELKIKNKTKKEWLNDKINEEIGK